MSVDYEVLQNFVDIDDLELNYHRVTNNINSIDIEDGIKWIFKYYREKGFPHYIVREEEKNYHINSLRKFDSDSIFINNQIQQTMHGLRLAWNYFPHWVDVQCGNSKMPPIGYFNDDDLLKTIIRKTWKYEEKHGNNKFTENRFRQSLKLYQGSQAVSNFRPSAAKVIYEKFGGETVWDMSCGWGGRLIGFLSSKNTKHYIGTEPSTKTYEGLLKIKKDFHYLGKKIDIYKRGSEEFRPEAETLDLCFTSPPYFDTEKYSDEPTQSYKKFSTPNEWVRGFLKKTIENCYYGLKKNGYMLINIANTPKYKFIEKETVRISNDIGFTQEPTVDLILSSVAGKGIKTEPIFVFKKEKLPPNQYGDDDWATP